MSDRYFNLRLACGFDTVKNDPTDLVVEVNAGSKWETLNPDVTTPGFLLFVFALFSCQLRYMRANSAECQLELESTRGEIKLVADDSWNVKNVFVSFESKLKNGQATAQDIAYIRERMTHCPVSANLRDSVDMGNKISFE